MVGIKRICSGPSSPFTIIMIDHKSYDLTKSLEFTFDSYPRKSRVQDLNLFKSDFGGGLHLFKQSGLTLMHCHITGADITPPGV